MVTITLDESSLALIVQSAIIGLTMSKELTARVVNIEQMLGGIQQQEKYIMADLTALTAEVARDTDVVSGAVTLINGFAAQLAAAGTDPAKLAALQTQLKTNTDSLAAAVAANTPSAPTGV